MRYDGILKLSGGQQSGLRISVYEGGAGSMEYFKDNDFFEKMEKVAVPKLDAARTSGYYTAYDGIKIY